MRVESGILFTELSVVNSDDKIIQESHWVKFAIELDLIDAFWEVNSTVTEDKALYNATKIFAADEYFLINMNFDKFTEILLKHKSSAKFFKFNN